MAIDLAAKRFILSDAELAKGFASARLKVPKAALYAGLPKASGQLAGPLAGDDGNLSAEARDCLAVMAEPLVSLRLLHWPDNSVSALETHFLSGDDGYVQFARPHGESWDIALHADRVAALSVLSGLVGPCPEATAAAGSRLPREGVSVSLTALALLGVLAAFAREARLLASYIAGQPRRAGAKLEFPPARIAAALREQAAEPDLTTQFARLVLATEGALLEAVDDDTMLRGFAELREAGLLGADYLPREPLQSLIEHLSYGSSLTVLQAMSLGAGGLELDTLLLHDGAAGRMAGTWLADGDGRIAAVHFAPVDDAVCGELLGELLD